MGAVTKIGVGHGGFSWSFGRGGPGRQQHQHRGGKRMARKRDGGLTQPGPNVAPDTVQQFTREMVTSRRAIHEAQGTHRAVVKRAKAAGVNIKALTEVVSNRALDSDEVSRHYRDVMYY